MLVRFCKVYQSIRSPGFRTLQCHGPSNISQLILLGPLIVCLVWVFIWTLKRTRLVLQAKIHVCFTWECKSPVSLTCNFLPQSFSSTIKIKAEFFSYFITSKLVNKPQITEGQIIEKSSI